MEGSAAFSCTAGADTLTGTARSNVFYGGKRNDTITGTIGCDVAVYTRTAWGAGKQYCAFLRWRATRMALAVKR